MPSNLTLDIEQGQDKDFLLQRKDSSGMAYASTTNPSPYLSTDTLSASLWPGGALAAIAAPSVTWVDAAGAATYKLTFAASDTASLSPGLYYWQVEVSRSGRTGTLGRGRLRIAGSPGSGSVPLAFSTRDDLMMYAPWLEDLQADSDELAFAAEQSRATSKLIDALVNLWRPNQWRPSLGQPGWNALNMSYGASAPPSWWLRQQLVPLVPNSGPNAAYPDRISFAANMVDSRVSTSLLLYPEVKEICARWAIAYACDAQLGRSGQESYRDFAREFRSDATSLFRTTRFQIDLSNPQTGWASFTIVGGGSSVR